MITDTNVKKGDKGVVALSKIASGIGGRKGSVEVEVKELHGPILRVKVIGKPRMFPVRVEDFRPVDY